MMLGYSSTELEEELAKPVVELYSPVDFANMVAELVAAVVGFVEEQAVERNALGIAGEEEANVLKVVIVQQDTGFDSARFALSVVVVAWRNTGLG